MDYIGQRFGNREIIRNHCVPSDWTDIDFKVPIRTDKYKLTRCLNCGRIMPAMIKNLINQPPKRCVFCSNIGNHNNVPTNTNAWTVYDSYAVCNVNNNGVIISFYIDADDYQEVSKYVWRISKKRRKYYVITGSAKKRTGIYLHEMLCHKNEDEEIDHIDGNSLNNRKSNLRAVSRQENIDNQRATRIDNSIGIRGISFDKRSRKYTVDFNYHNKRFYTRPWDTLEEAVWCRYCFEDYYDLPAIKNNPLAEQYYTLSDDMKREIQQYVYQKILGNER